MAVNYRNGKLKAVMALNVFLLRIFVIGIQIKIYIGPFFSFPFMVSAADCSVAMNFFGRGVASLEGFDSFLGRARTYYCKIRVLSLGIIPLVIDIRLWFLFIGHPPPRLWSMISGVTLEVVLSNLR